MALLLLVIDSFPYAVHLHSIAVAGLLQCSRA